MVDPTDPVDEPNPDADPTDEDQDDESGEDESGWDKLKSCAADQLGVTNLGLAGAASGANVLPTRGTFDGATPGTSPASKVAQDSSEIGRCPSGSLR